MTCVGCRKLPSMYHHLKRETKRGESVQMKLFISSGVVGIMSKQEVKRAALLEIILHAAHFLHQDTFNPWVSRKISGVGKLFSNANKRSGAWGRFSSCVDNDHNFPSINCRLREI